MGIEYVENYTEWTVVDEAPVTEWFDTCLWKEFRFEEGGGDYEDDIDETSPSA